jgi:hypothetical protein
MPRHIIKNNPIAIFQIKFDASDREAICNREEENISWSKLEVEMIW